MTTKEKDVKTNVLPHTQAKLDLYKGYLEHYLRVLCNAPFCKQINIFDIYCGAGIYDDGKKGSPLLTIDCIRNVREKMADNGNPITSISLLVNDYDVQKLENVKKNTNIQGIEKFTIEYSNQDANKMLEIVSIRISEYPKDHRNLIFIDPYGYSNINKEKIANLIKNNCTEIVLFLPVNQMYRFTEIAFLDEERPHYEKLRQFIVSFFDNPLNINAKSIFDYIHSIKEALSIDNTYYTCSHYIEREKGNYYAIFFITSNIYGLEKMIETKWKLDPVKGKGFQQSDDSKQLSMFDDEIKEIDYKREITYFESLIYGAIKRSGILSNIELYELTLKNEFLPKHANSVLKNLLKSNKVREIYNSKGFGIDYTNYRGKIIYSKFEVI